MSLKEEIKLAQAEIRTDDYPMSLGELTNIYRDGELRINPSFQRLFRWSLHQKSAFIESILIGIPIPPIFVFEMENGHWELIDGLQRTSTILEFQGLLRSPSGELLPPSVLMEAEYLPSLNNAVWDTELSDNLLGVDIGQELRIAIKRSKIGIQILKKGSDERSKYDLFQRLNGNGSDLSAQEFRTCVMAMLGEPQLEACIAASEDKRLLSMINLGRAKLEQQGSLDYVCRFIAHLRSDRPKGYDVEEFITHEVKEAFIRNEVARHLDILDRTLTALHGANGGDALRRFEDGGFRGRTGKAAFEGILIGVARNIDAIENLPDANTFIENKSIEFWESDVVAPLLRGGVRGTTRIDITVPLGQSLFTP